MIMTLKGILYDYPTFSLSASKVLPMFVSVDPLKDQRQYETFL